MMEYTKVLGVDIGGTKIAVSLADSEGNLLDSRRIPSAQYEENLADIIDAAKEMLAAHHLKTEEIPCCGISAPGPLDMENGRFLSTPNLDWHNVPIRDDLANALGMRAVLENDANAGVLAEHYFGLAKGKTDAVYLTMSTGVGAGVISGGKLITGKTGIGTEMGHVVLDVNGPQCNCGLRGCMEAYCGGRAMALRVQEMLRDKPDHPMMQMPGVDGKLENLSYQTVRDAAKAGIPLAVELWEENCMRLAQGLGIVLATFNPEIIILGTSAYYAGDFLMKPVLEKLSQFTWPEFLECCEIRATQLGPKVGELAGASVALYAL